MPVEVATYVSELDTSNPDGDSQKYEGDNHLQLIKSVLQSTFPNADGAITATVAELNYLSGVTSGVLHSASLAALPAGIGTTTPVAGYFTTLQSNGEDVVVDTRLVDSGAGLTGGGVLSADRTLAVGEGTGISVAADSVGLDTSHDRNVDHSAIDINVSGGNLSGGGSIDSDVTITLTDETIQDLVGAMVTGNTETGITVTYQDGDGTLDFSVPAASTSTAGRVELATAAEILTGSSTSLAVTPGNVTKSFSTNGYFAFAGLCVQWGRTSSSTADITVSLNTSFSDSNYAVMVTENLTASTGLEHRHNVESKTTSQFVIDKNNDYTVSYDWIAVGRKVS